MVLANGQRAGFFIGDGAGVGKGRQVSIFRVQFHAVTTWSMNCYFTVTIIKNDGHFHWVANLPHFHDCKSTCLVFILKPCDITGVFHCLNHVKPLKIWSCFGILFIPGEKYEQEFEKISVLRVVT